MCARRTVRRLVADAHLLGDRAERPLVRGALLGGEGSDGDGADRAGDDAGLLHAHVSLSLSRFHFMRTLRDSPVTAMAVLPSNGCP